MILLQQQVRVVINGVRQWEWDLNIGGNVNTGANDFVRFVPGTSVGTGTWSKSNGETGVRGTTNTNEISFINPSDGDVEIIIHATDATLMDLYRTETYHKNKHKT